MNGKIALFASVLGILPAGLPANTVLEGTVGEDLLIDDFSDPNGRSKLGGTWVGFTDRVMGGISTMRAAIVPGDNGQLLRMYGEVSLENNGGFIQVRLALANGGTPFDAGDYRGVALRVRGRGEGYYVHVRTSATRLPWAYYSAEVPVEDNWRTVRIEFDSFDRENIRRRMDTSRIVSLAVVAAKTEFDPFIEIDRVSLYK